MNISLVIPTRNRPLALERALASGGVGIESVFVVDDYSSVSALEQVRRVCRSDNRVQLLENSRRMGAAICRNQGVRGAQTEWLLFLDDDDQLCEGFFDSMVQLLGSDPKVQAWIPDVRNAWQRHLSPVERSDALARNRVGGCSGFLIRKSLFEAVGGFDEDFPSMQDWDLWLRLIERNALYYSGVTGVIYDPNSEQKITHNLLAKYRGLRRLYFKHLNLWTPSAREQNLLRLWVLRRLLAGQIGVFGNWLASGFKLHALYYTHRWRRFAPSQTSSAKQTL